jgi:hypothetical protein
MARSGHECRLQTFRHRRCDARQNHPDLGELARLTLNLLAQTMFVEDADPYAESYRDHRYKYDRFQ